MIVCESMVSPRPLREAVAHVLFRFLQVKHVHKEANDTYLYVSQVGRWQESGQARSLQMALSHISECSQACRRRHFPFTAVAGSGHVPLYLFLYIPNRRCRFSMYVRFFPNLLLAP